MKAVLRFLSDLCWTLGFASASTKLFVMSLDVRATEQVRIDVEMSTEVKQLPRVTFEDKEAIAALSGYDFEKVAVVNSTLDVN